MDKKFSMEVMGFKKEELIPELEVIEATDYLKDALQSDIQLFI
ncbi:DsrE/DsrF/DrsH-like family protein [Clostridium sp.]